MAYERVLSPGERWLLELRDRKILWVIPILALAYFVWILIVLSSADPPVFPTSTWVLLGGVIFVVMIAFEALLLVKTRTRPVVYPGSRPAAEEDVDEHGRVPPPKGQVRQDYETATWPPEEEGDEALYVSHYIVIDDDLVLKFRQEIEEEWIGWG